MNWNELLDSAYCRGAVLHTNRAETAVSYDRVFFLTQELPFFSPQAIYFSTWENYLRFAPEGDFTFIVFMEGADAIHRQDLFDQQRHSENRVILMTDTLSYSDCCRGLFTYMDTMQHMLSCAQELQTMAANNSGISRMVDAVADACNCHTSLIDNAYSIVAYSRSHAPGTSTMVNNNTLGYLDLPFQQTLKKECFAANTVQEKRKAIHFVSRVDGVTIHNYFVRVLINDLTVGFLGVTSAGQPLSHGREEQLWRFSDAFSTEMQKSSFYLLNKQTFYTHLISELLQPNLIQDNDMEARLRSFGYKLQPYKYVLSVDIRNEMLNSGGLQALAEQLHSLFTNSIYLIRENSIVYLLSRSEESLLSDQEIASWAETIGNSRIKVGVSRMYENLLDTAFHLGEANRALACGSFLAPNDCIYRFSDYVLHDLVYQLSQHVGTNIYCHPALQRLYDYDQKHKTNLCLTLQYFLQDQKHPLEVSRKLFIHKNTLYYRLEKIRAITGCDFDDTRTAAEFLISFYIYRLQGKTKELPPV